MFVFRLFATSFLSFIVKNACLTTNLYIESIMYFFILTWWWDVYLQEKIMRVPYGPQKEYFTFSLFLVFCNRITTSAVSAGVLLVLESLLA